MNLGDPMFQYTRLHLMLLVDLDGRVACERAFDRNAGFARNASAWDFSAVCGEVHYFGFVRRAARTEQAVRERTRDLEVLNRKLAAEVAERVTAE